MPIGFCALPLYRMPWEWRRLCQTQSADPLANHHWEFLAIALLHRYDQANALPAELRDRLERMRPFWHPRHESMNFRLMRAVAEARLAGRWIERRDLDAMGLKPCPDGALPDGREGLSSQYHAYMLLLLLRWGEKQDAALRHIIQNSFAWLAKVWRTYGDPNPLGRGRFQLFGYAALAAACHFSDDWGLPQPQDYLAQIHDRLDPEQPDGALSARWTGPFRNALLHGYNTPDDYRAFAEFWAADLLCKRACEFPSTLIRYPLDFFGASLIADGSGPLFALTSAPSGPPEDIGRKKEIRQMLRTLFRRSRYAENLQPETLTDDGFRVKGARFHYDGRRLTMDVPGFSAWHSPVVWTKQSVMAPEPQGTMEIQRWEWSRPGTPIWIGYSFRVFGSAQVRWILS
jgi:hypothetical protein